MIQVFTRTLKKDKQLLNINLEINVFPRITIINNHEPLTFSLVSSGSSSFSHAAVGAPHEDPLV
jgi:predicted ATP-binding protein involved in virulence